MKQTKTDYFQVLGSKIKICAYQMKTPAMQWKLNLQLSINTYIGMPLFRYQFAENRKAI